MKCSDIEKRLEQLVPRKLSAAAGKENIGLIVGRSDKNVSTIVISYCVDQETVDYAVSVQADMILSCEPVIQEPLLTIGSDSTQGRLLLQLLRHDIACYAIGSGLEWCKGGLSDWMATKMDLSGVCVTQPLTEYEAADGSICQGGIGRIGHYKKKKMFGELTDRIESEFSQEIVTVYGRKEDCELPFSDVAVLVWADESRLDAAIERGAQMIVTCGVSYKDAMKASKKHRVVVELSGEVAEGAFCELSEQYLSEVLSSSVEILTMPTQRMCQFLTLGKESE